MELGSFFLFLQEQIKDIIIIGSAVAPVTRRLGTWGTPNIDETITDLFSEQKNVRNSATN